MSFFSWASSALRAASHSLGDTILCSFVPVRVFSLAMVIDSFGGFGLSTPNCLGKERASEGSRPHLASVTGPIYEVATTASSYHFLFSRIVLLRICRHSEAELIFKVSTSRSRRLGKSAISFPSNQQAMRPSR